MPADHAPSSDDRHPLIMVVCFPVSIHAARWVDLLRHSRFRVVVFPSVLQPYCPDFTRDRLVRSSEDVTALAPGQVGIVDDALIESVALSARERELGYQPMDSAVKVTDTITPSPSSLTDVIEMLQPALLHSMELQHGGYLCLEARKRMGDRFPRWLVSNWGSDIYLYRKLPVHQQQLRSLAEHIDVLHSDCDRDHALVRELGFTGPFFPSAAASGGVDLREYPDPSLLPAPSQRRMIMIKGYHGWAGRGLHILLAIHRIAPQLQGFHIRISHTLLPMQQMAEALVREDGLDIQVDPYFPDHASAVQRLAQARVVVGFGISDGISTSLLEAMAVGTFCIQASTACGDEWIVPGETGLIVSPHDVAGLAEAILLAATDDRLVDEAVTRNRETIMRRWDAGNVVDTILRGYEEALTAGAGQHG